MTRILIADDDTVSLRMLQRTLERADFKVIAVSNGAEAAEELCRSNGPRLALLDWEMPQLDGPEVCRQVRKLRSLRHVHLVLLSSKGSKDDIVEGLESGADDYLIKPFDAGELKARLHTGLRILRLEDNLLEAREEMHYKATHDSLTLLLNRGAIFEILGMELVRSHRDHSCTTVALGDLDHFKQINDTYGHPAGDEVLREVGRRMLSSVRPCDFVGRYGGEEFLIVMIHSSASQALKRAEEIRKSICDRPIHTPNGLISISISIGVCSSSDNNSWKVEEMLNEVDRALYAAKAAGRNCCRLGSDFDSAEQAHLEASSL
jgi:diguanylate cyclase (GGDEF)-like protein